MEKRAVSFDDFFVKNSIIIFSSMRKAILWNAYVTTFYRSEYKMKYKQVAFRNTFVRQTRYLL